MRAFVTVALAGLAVAVAPSCSSKRSERKRAAPSDPAGERSPAVLELTAATRLGKPLVTLDPPLVARIRARPEVLGVVPRLALRAPAQGAFTLGDKEVRIEVVCDGIDPDLVKERQPGFRDWGAGPAADAPNRCNEAADCPAELYCDERDGRCHHRVPILISPTLLELYSAQYAPDHDLPPIDPARFDAAAYRESPLRIELGRSMVTGVVKSKGPEPFAVEGQLVGVDPHAMAIGMTVPLGYVQRWNGALLSTTAPAGYTSLEVTLRPRASSAGLRRWAESLGLRADQLER